MVLTAQYEGLAHEEKTGIAAPAKTACVLNPKVRSPAPDHLAMDAVCRTYPAGLGMADHRTNEFRN